MPFIVKVPVTKQNKLMQGHNRGQKGFARIFAFRYEFYY